MGMSGTRRVLSSLMMLCIVVSVNPSGRREDPIRRARELVSASRVNEAILLLEQTVREDPDRIVEAEALLRTIREIRGEYNVLFEQLIDNLVNNPDNIDRTLEIIDMMEALDEFPNERVISQVQDARVIAQLAFDRNVVDVTMDQARELLAAERFVEAIQLYYSLRDLQRDRFEIRGFGDIFVNRVNQTVDRLAGVVDDALVRAPEYVAAGDDVLEIASFDLTILEPEDLDFFLERASGMVDVVQRAGEVTRELVILKSQVALQFPNVPVDWYLNFQEIVTRGRSEFRDREGIDYAIRRIYGDSLESLAELTRTRTEESFQQALQLASQGSHDAAAGLYDAASRAAAIWELAESSLVGVMDPFPTPGDFAAVVDAADAEPFLRARGIRIAAESLGELSTTRASVSFIAAEPTQPAAFLGEQKDLVADLVALLRGGETRWQGESAAIRETYREELSVLPQDVLQTTDRRWQEAITAAVRQEWALAVARSGSRTIEVPSGLDEINRRLGEVEPLLAGVEEVIIDDDEVLSDEEEIQVGIRIVRYPDDASQRLQLISNDLQQELERILLTRAELLDDQSYVIDSPVVTQESSRLLALEARAQQLQDRVTADADQARALIAEAEQRRNQGFQRVADARGAISAIQLNAARNNWNAAREAFFDSLELREDSEFREEADRLIQQLGLELLELENVIVVQRVRELLTAAETQYNQDQYIAARDTLLEAQQTWEQTNVETNSEIDRWLVLTTAAISLEEGRDLTPADPLYPILGNYLSLAREDFNQAVSLHNDGVVERADVLFERSLRNLRNVRDVRPLNWEARILELEIAQIRNPDDFDNVFATRYQQAIARLPEVGPLEVYSELEVLAEINPDFPGIQAQIRQLEIALNLRPDPVDQGRITQARQLFQRAQQLSGGTRDQAIVAVSLLEEAVNLNPGDSNVRFLLDQLRIRLGGQATVALTAVDEQQYRRAETLFSQGQVLQALGIVERLLASSGNQGYPPLVELRRRIGLRLGI